MFPDKYDMELDAKGELNPAMWEFVKAECAAVAEPPELKARLRKLLSESPAPVAKTPVAVVSHVKISAANTKPVARPAAGFWKRNFPLGAVAALLLVTLWLTGTMHDECPYIMACINEHRRAFNGQDALLKTSSDTKTLGEYASEQIHAPVSAPKLEQYLLKPVGAGKAEFASLKAASAPDGVFVKYEGIGNQVATVLIQPWADGSPQPWNKMQFQGRTFWATSHEGKSVASWKSKDGRLILSLVTDHSLSETLDMAVAAGDQM